MTINRQAFEDVLSFAELTSTRINLLSDVVTLSDSAHPFNATFINMFENIENIEAWANAAIEQANQEEQQIVMDNFLAEMKVVFDKYSASVEVGNPAEGYGTNYGGGGAAWFKLSATFEGTTATKEINKSVIVGSDLV